MTALQNALAEAFFATLETKLLMRDTFIDRRAARRALFDYIEGWYNPHRRHSALEYLSQAEYERRWSTSVAWPNYTLHETGATSDDHDRYKTTVTRFVKPGDLAAVYVTGRRQVAELLAVNAVSKLAVNIYGSDTRSVHEFMTQVERPVAADVRGSAREVSRS